MGLDLSIVLTIAGMSLVTYVTRITGLLLMSRVSLLQRNQAWLAGIPGAVLVSIVAPGVLARGPAEALAGLLTAVVAIRTRNMLLSAAVGVAAVWALRHAL